MSDRIRAHVFRHDGASGRIILCAPPGHAKSDTVSIHTPLWFIDLFSDKNLVIASNTAILAQRWSRIIRNTLETNEEFFLTRVSKDSSAVNLWHTTDGGVFRAVGIGGLLSGFRANLLICDDPIADPKEANSEVQRENLWEWFNMVADTRCWPDATMVVMHTRWNEDDLVGRLLQQQKEMLAQGLPIRPWEVVNLPAMAEEGDLLGREPGEPLWPEEFPKDVLEIEKAKGSYRWASLYQQRPAPAGGSVFRREHFRSFTQDGQSYVLERPGVAPKVVPLSACRIYQTADTALTAKTTSDWTVCVTYALTPDNEILVLEVARARLDVPEQMGFLMAQRFRWNPVWQGLEEKASGIGLIQQAAQDGRPFKKLNPGTVDKVTRTGPISVMYENGSVYHRKGAAWLADFEAELLVFPNGAHDDQVDCMSYAGREVAVPAPYVMLI